MPTKDGWTLEREHEKVTLGKKQYRNMEEWTRPCAVCAAKFSIFVRANGGGGVNASFGLKTCKEHRGQRLAGGSNVDVKTLRDEMDLLRSELDLTVSKFDYDALLAKHKAQFEELQVLKARLAKYELQPAMEEMQNKFPWG
jgi:hypothetical protein